MSDAHKQLQNGVALAELGGHGDGPYCAKYGAGAALVMLGTYIVDAGDDVPYPSHFVFKPGRENYAEYLNEHVAAARQSGAAVGVSIISVAVADSVDFLLAAEEAGADYSSLCLHSSMEMFTRHGLGMALLRRENWPALREWISAILDATSLPFIAKIGVEDARDIEQAVEVMAEAGVNIIHANLYDALSNEGLQALSRLKSSGLFLIIGGGIKTAAQADRVIAAGGDAVAVGTAAMQDPGLCGRLQSAIRSAKTRSC